MKRRVFVGGVFAGVGLGARRAPAAKAGDIPTRVFGKTGQKLTIVGQAAGRFPLISFEEATAVVRRAVELGVNYFDNARVYWDGRAEEVYGAVLPAVRKQVFITTKSVRRTRKEAEEDLDASLRALKTDYIDLWQIHSVSEMDDVERIFAPGGAIEAFEAAKKAGKCRFIGFTGHRDPEVLLEMLKRYDGFDTILMPLHAADPAYLSFEERVLPEAVKRGLGIQAMKSLANAKLLQSFSVRQCLDYVLSLPIHCVTMGATTVGQIEDDVRLARQFRPLAAEQMAELRQRAKFIAGPRLEDWKRNIERAGDSAARYQGG
jgi:predicted aldo/keto reductase-like oxidoreductase